MSTEYQDREELLRKADEVRSHMVANLEEFERKSHDRIALHGHERLETDEAPLSPERKRLERRADRVRNRLIDRIEAIEVSARQRILPIVVTGSAVLLFLTVGFGVLLYRSLKS